MNEIPKKHSEFNALAQGQVDYTIPVIPIKLKEHGLVMCIATPEAAIYVTKEQAKAFFGL